MSALPPKADIAEHDWDVRFGPEAQLGFAPGIGEGSKHGRFGFGVNRSTDLFYLAVEEKIIRYE
jgi:hypothetical protein